MSAKVFPIIALVVLLLSGGALVYSLDTTTKADGSRVLFASPSEVWSSAEGFLGSITDGIASLFMTPESTSKQESAPSPSPSVNPRTTPTPTPSPKTSPQPAATSKPTATPKPSVTPKPAAGTNETSAAPTNCRRFVVKHLDGSQSNRCYTSADYAELSRLSGQLSSAQTFYQFHMDGVARYQKLYDESGSSLWQDARASSQASADQEQSKIGPLQLQMYTIESRGKD